MDADYKWALITDGIWVVVVLIVWWQVWRTLTKNWEK